MNIFRTLILISVIQISGIFANKSWETLQLTQIAGNVFKEVKCKTSSNFDASTNDLLLNKNEELRSLTSQICSKEISLKSTEQASFSSNNSNDTPSIKTTIKIRRPVKVISGLSQIIFNESVRAELF